MAVFPNTCTACSLKVTDLAISDGLTISDALVIGSPGGVSAVKSFSKESLVCVTSMVSFQVFVRLPKLCQREMSRVLKICSEAIE